MRNVWITTEGATATQALNQDAGDVHAPSLRKKRAPSTTVESPPAPRSPSCYRNLEDVAPSIVVHHEHTNVVSPDISGNTHRSPLHTDSATMTAPDATATATPSPGSSRSWEAPGSQVSLDRSAQVRPCSSQVLEESALSPVPEIF